MNDGNSRISINYYDYIWNGLLHREKRMKRVQAISLIDSLLALPEDHYVSVNAVGNLTILDVNFEYVGYIDFIDDGHVEYFKENDDDT